MLNQTVLEMYAKEENAKQLAEVLKSTASYLSIMTVVEDPEKDPSITTLEAVEKAAERLRKATFRILQYNSKCQEATGEAFITRKINRSSVRDCQKLVRFFMNAVMDILNQNENLIKEQKAA